MRSASTDVDRYRDLVAADGCVVVLRGAEHRFDRIGPRSTDDGLRPFGDPAALVLRLLRRHELRRAHEARARMRWARWGSNPRPAD
jgi:hypothetical protein